MGVGQPEKKRGRLETTYGTKRLTQEELESLMGDVTHVFVDIEGRVYSQCCRSVSFELLVQEIVLLVENMVQASPLTREISFGFDFTPTKPWEIKNIMRLEKHSKEPIDEKYVSLLDPFLLVDATATKWKEFKMSMNRALIQSEADYLSRCMETPFLRRCIRRLWAEKVFERCKEKWPKELIVNVVNVEQEDGSYHHFTNGARMQNICNNSAGEAELEIISRLSRCTSNDVVRIISEDSDVLAALPMALHQLGKNAPRVILDFGNSTKIFDATHLYSGMLQTGQLRSITNMDISHAVEYAMGGSDYVRNISGFGDARVYAFMNAIGYYLVKTAIWVVEKDGQVSLDVSLENMRRIVHLAMAVDEAKNAPKNVRQERFVALKNREKFDLPSLEELREETADRTPQAGIVVPTVNECNVFAHQIVWQVLYWFFRHRDKVPDEFAVKNGLSLWGWTRDANGKAIIAHEVYCGSLK